MSLLLVFVFGHASTEDGVVVFWQMGTLFLKICLVPSPPTWHLSLRSEVQGFSALSLGFSCTTGAGYGVGNQIYLKELFDSLRSRRVVLRNLNRLLLQWAQDNRRHSIPSI